MRATTKALFPLAEARANLHQAGIRHLPFRVKQDRVLKFGKILGSGPAMTSVLPESWLLRTWCSSSDHSNSLTYCHNVPPRWYLAQVRVLEAVGEVVGYVFGEAGISAFVCTRSKSTNHDLQIARAIASSVLFMRRFSSILSSSVPRIWAIARCSSVGGICNGRFSNVSELRRPVPCSAESTIERASPYCREGGME